MGARNKLNAGFITGAMVIAGMAGLITSSGGVFVVVCIALIVCSIIAGDIRPGGAPGRGHSGRPRFKR